MTSTPKTIELLAAAKNTEIGKAAIQCGADALYVGAAKFGAREDAGVNLADIEALVSYAHTYRARVYVALNTLLGDRELEEAFALIRSLAQIGIDGLIVQDVGLLELPLPPIPLFASTQMHNDSLEKILFLEKAGFSRVILPREMTLEEIGTLRKKTSIEFECFVHGALCVSYSGQCYMSFAIGGRSANRGACAQPCRRVYSLVDEKGNVLSRDKHLLSLKDLNRSEDLAALIAAGVTSFKIEGRLKDASYVKNIVGFYRMKLDALLSGKKGMKKSSSGTTTLCFTPDPHKTFNRGYTDFGLKGENTGFSSHQTPKSLGEKIGSIEKIGPRFFTLTSKQALQSGDGICFFDAHGVLRGSVINDVKDARVFPDKMAGLAPQSVLYRNHDHAFVKSLNAKDACERKIGLSFVLGETQNGFSLTARDEDENTVVFSLDSPKEAAQKKEQALENLKKQLSKINDTVFRCDSITHTLKEIYFLPVSLLNTLRRGAVEKLLEERGRNTPFRKVQIRPTDHAYPLGSIDYLGNCMNRKALDFYHRHKVKVTEMAAETGLPMQGRRLMYSKYCVKGELGLCKQQIGNVFLVDETGKKFRLEFDCAKCRMSVFDQSSSFSG